LNKQRIYHFIFQNLPEESGTINLRRLMVFLQQINTIARGALLLQLAGSSRAKPDPLINLEKALQIEVCKLRKGGTIVEMRTMPFSDTLWHLQFSIFDGAKEQHLLSLDPISLVMEVLKSSASLNDFDNIDADLIKDIFKMHRIFGSQKEKLRIKSQSGTHKMQMGKGFFEKIRRLEQTVASPQKCSISGTIEEIQFSKAQIKLQTPNGLLLGRLAQGHNQILVSENWGKNVTVAGTVFYKPNGGILYLEIEQIKPEPIEPEHNISQTELLF
jgi:hypothetical protein